MTSTDALKTLNTEIMAGKGPDILILDGIPEDTYVEKGMLEDLSGILDKVDETDGILKNIRDAYTQEDGSIYCMPVKFGIPMIQGTQKDVDAVTDLKSLADVIEQHQEEYHARRLPLYQTVLPEILLKSLAEVCSPAWVKEDGTLDETAVTEYLEQANRIYQVGKESVKEWNGGEEPQYNEEEYGYLNSGISTSAVTLLRWLCFAGDRRITLSKRTCLGRHCGNRRYFSDQQALERTDRELLPSGTDNWYQCKSSRKKMPLKNLWNFCSARKGSHLERMRAFRSIRRCMKTASIGIWEEQEHPCLMIRVQEKYLP